MDIKNLLMDVKDLLSSSSPNSISKRHLSKAPDHNVCIHSFIIGCTLKHEIKQSQFRQLSLGEGKMDIFA